MDAFKRNYIPTKNEVSTNIKQDNKIENNYEIENNENHYTEKIVIDNKKLEESSNLKKEKNIRIQEIMVGDRRMERFDGAEYNNQNLNQNINFNNFIPYNTSNDQIHLNSIDNNIDEPQTQPRLNPHLTDSPHPISRSPNQSQNFNCNIDNYYNNSPKNNTQAIIKDKNTFMTNKNDEYINNNNNSNLQQNQSFKSAINSTQISQQMNQEYLDLSLNEKDAKIMPQQYSQQPQMINQNQYKYKSEGNNFIVDVLYPKPGYGNSDEGQNNLKKKKKKKKIKYVRRLKPLVEQHFDVQIIQVPDTTNYNKPNQEPQNLLSNNFPPMVIPAHGPFPQKVIPHIPDKYKIKKSNNNNTQDLCNCPKFHREYNPIINNNSVQFGSKFGEQEINQNDFKGNCRPTQTLINITPMRTIFRPNYNNDIPYNNKERYFRSEGYREYRPLTPSNHMHNEKRFNEFERYGCSPGVPKRKNSFSFYHKENVGGRIVHSYVDNGEMNREMGCTCCIYAK